MRISAFFKNIFSDETPEEKIVTKQELDRKIKTKTVLVTPDVITKIFKFFVNREDVERICLLIGRVVGEFLLIENVYCCPDTIKATAFEATVPAKCFSEASKISDGNYIVGLSHSHVGGVHVFMSEKDRQVQNSFQVLFSDSVSLVMNPFADDGVKFSFYRIHDGNMKKLDFKYVVKQDENQT